MGKRIAQRRRAALMAAVSASVLLWNVSARADATWNPSVPDGSWSTAANWIGGVVPTTGEVTISFNDSASHAITLDGMYQSGVFLRNQGTGVAVLAINNPASSLGGSLDIGEGGNGVVNQSNGTVSSEMMLLTDSASGTATYNLSGGAVSQLFILVGNSGTAVFNQSGGNVVSYELCVGGSQGHGSYLMSDGSLTTQEEEIYGGTGTAVFLQTGGTHVVYDPAQYPMGLVVGDAGLYRLDGGSLNVNRESIDGAFNQIGGIHTVGTSAQAVSLSVGRPGTFNVTAQYSLGGGTLNVLGYEALNGTFNQSGGTHNVSGGSTAEPALLALSSGTYTLSGDGVLAVDGSEYIGYSGSSSLYPRFNQLGGTHNVGVPSSPGTLCISGIRSPVYNLSGNSSLNVIGYEYVAGGYGLPKFVQSGGVHSIGTGLVPSFFYVGYTSLIPPVAIGDRIAFLPFPEYIHPGYGPGRYQLSGGTLSVIGSEYIGYNDTGTFLHSGGYHALNGELAIATTAQAKGFYSLSGGSASLGNVFIGGTDTESGGLGTFAVSGGTLAVPGTLKIWNTGTLLFTGGSVSAGTIDVTGTVSLGAGTGRVLRTGALTVQSPGQVDLADDTIAIDYAGASPVNSIIGYLASGYDGGAWDGSGIVSSVAKTDSTRRVSYNDDGSHILLQLSLGGDANLDGKVDLLDLQTLASHWNGSANWSGGDFNYDGVVDLADLQIAARNWQVGVVTPDSTPLADVLTSLGLPIVEVPEPSIVTTIALAGILRRRRR